MNAKNRIGMVASAAGGFALASAVFLFGFGQAEPGGPTDATVIEMFKHIAPLSDDWVVPLTEEEESRRRDELEYKFHVAEYSINALQDVLKDPSLLEETRIKPRRDIMIAQIAYWEALRRSLWTEDMYLREASGARNEGLRPNTKPDWTEYRKDGR